MKIQNHQIETKLGFAKKTKVKNIKSFKPLKTFINMRKTIIKLHRYN